MLRRIAITLATVTAAGFMAAAPAAAGTGGGEVGAGYFEIEGARSDASYLNLGGPYGITYAKEKKAAFEAEGGYFYKK